MTPAAAVALAHKIVQTWTGGPKEAIWAEELEELDEGTAGTAYARLRRECEHCPSIAKFIAEYRALRTPHNVDKPECVWCDGTGWVEGPDQVFPPSSAHPNGYTDSTVVPCPCKEYGDQARRVHQTILKMNAS